MKTKLIFLTTIIPTTFLTFSLINACAAQNVTNQPATSDKPSGDPKPPPPDSSGSGNNSNIGSIEIPTEIITELPKENITENTSILPLGKLVKYVLEIPKIKINGLPLTLEQQKERYLDVLEYISGYRNDDPTSITNAKPNSFYDHAQFMGASLGSNNEGYENVREIISKLNKYMAITERIFYLEKDEWIKSLKDRIGDDVTILSLFLPFHMQALNMKQVSRFLFFWSAAQIQLIDARNQTGSAQTFFLNNKNFMRAIKNALSELQIYFNPLTGQMALKTNLNDGLFFYDADKTKITDNPWVYKMLVQVANQTLSPLTFFLDNNNTFYEKLPKHYRGSEEVFAQVAGEKVKYRKDFNQGELQAFWTKWFETNKQTYNWQFDQE